MILLLSLGASGPIIFRRIDGRRQIAAVLTQRPAGGGMTHRAQPRSSTLSEGAAISVSPPRRFIGRP